MIYFYLPDFYYFFSINVTIINLLRNNPEKFYPNIKIGAIYGCFPRQIWNGGRALIKQSADIDNIIGTIQFYDNLDIPIRFTYTNCLLEEKHLDDKHCNFITENADNGKNEILINSPILEEYLRKTYPNFKYISSATKCIRDINKLNELINSDEYYLVLGDYRDNFDFEFLNKIEQKDKLELLIDPWCNQECELRDYHYKVLSQTQLGLQPDEYPQCKWEGSSWYDIFNAGHIIKVEDLYSKYVDMGFKHFKLEGRNLHPVDVVDSYVYYLVKPEFQNEIRNILLKSHYQDN